MPLLSTSQTKAAPLTPINDAPEPDIDSPLEDRHVGGLGVYLARTMMDELTYRRENSRNHLTLVKRREE